jgi:hypothetical protein
MSGNTKEKAKASRLKRKVKLAELAVVRGQMFRSMTEEQQAALTEALDGVITEYQQGLDEAGDRLLNEADETGKDLVETWGYDVVTGALDGHTFYFAPLLRKLGDFVDANAEYGESNITGSMSQDVICRAEELMPEAKVNEWGNVYFFDSKEEEEDVVMPSPEKAISYALPSAAGRCRECENPLLADGKCVFINHN